jgi:hypothetical protein
VRYIYIAALLTALTITAIIMYPEYTRMRNIQQFCKQVSTQDFPQNVSTSSDNKMDFWNKHFAEKRKDKEEKAYLKCVIKLTHKAIQ